MVNAGYLGTNNGDNTQDKVYLLSVSEVQNENFGFPNRVEGFSETLKARNTDYVYNKGVYNSDNNGFWWLRSPGVIGISTSYVDYGGSIIEPGGDAVCTGFGVRPALHLDLSSSVWSYAGIVNSGDGEDHSSGFKLGRDNCSFSNSKNSSM